MIQRIGKKRERMRGVRNGNIRKIRLTPELTAHIRIAKGYQAIVVKMLDGACVYSELNAPHMHKAHTKETLLKAIIANIGAYERGELS